MYLKKNAIWLVALLLCMAVPALGATLDQKELLGKKLFDDLNLSLNANQSCAACHTGEVGWTGPHSEINAHGAVYEGSIPGAFGDRKPPSSGYATQAPLFHYSKQGGGLFVGGNFWDGRATGWKLGNPAADQAQGPFLNPKEQALPDAAAVMAKVCVADYADLFQQVWGLDPCDTGKTDLAYDYVGLAIAAYEASPEVNAFSSKFDLARRGKAKLNKQEQRGWALFMGKGKCHLCHVPSGKLPLFTDYTFDNLGIPKNPENPATLADPDFADPGLAGFLRALAAADNQGWRDMTYTTNVAKFSNQELLDLAAAHEGMHKVPTLRNVDKRPAEGFVKAFGHNGYFKSLKGIVHFYNTRDVLPRCQNPLTTEAEALAQNCWPAPEIANNVNTAELGNLGLSDEEEKALVAFMKTLSDGFGD
ncbi:c-type cytochrome [Desulfuromonas versatilis]|uniref:C-type cytochrome n=1 Tax=Desulfuromonas versatilis TaxID=2802975 RepID=A0ABN6E027_9BACT|nr:cytochrome c peroxidase [Desulfuromonas versatilis]BCR04481.1 c-type cytochrome [Desulfuromonas versatilis]